MSISIETKRPMKINKVERMGADCENIKWLDECQGWEKICGKIHRDMNISQVLGGVK